MTSSTDKLSSATLGGLVAIRRRSILADVASARRGASPSIATTGAIVRVGVDAHTVSDVKALDDEIAATHDRIKKAAEAGTSGMLGLLADYMVLENAWRSWLEDKGFDENLKLSWWKSDTWPADSTEAREFEDYKTRKLGFDSRYVKLRKDAAGKAIEDLPSGFGEPLPPVVPGEAPESKPSPAGGGAPHPTSDGAVPPVATAGASTGTFALLLVLAAGVGGYLALRAGWLS